MMKKMSIRSRLIAVFGTLIILSLGIVGTVTNFLSNSTITDLTSLALKNDVQGIYRSLTMAYRVSLITQKHNIAVASYHTKGLELNNETQISVEAINQITKESKNIKIPQMELRGEGMYQNPKLIKLLADQIETTVTIFQKIDEGYLRITTNIMTNEGKLAIGTFIPNSSAVAQALDRGEDYVGRAYVVNGWYVTAYHPIKDVQGKIIGAVYTGLNEKDSLEEFINEIKNLPVLKKGYYFIADYDFNLVVHPKSELVGKSMKDIDQATSELADEFGKANEGLVTSIKGNSNIVGKAIYYYKKFDSMKWVIVAKAYDEDFTAPVRELRNSNIMISVILIFVAFVAVYFIGSSISSPILRISESLINTSKQVGVAAENLTEASQNLSEGAAAQASSVEETTASLEELNGMIKQNEDSNAHNSKNAEGVFQESEVANSSMESLKHAMGEIMSSNDRIDELVSIIRKIADKTAVMDEIVFQTKLLSFNASVEAERAGEHGRGFAVVAQEVGNLASMSGKAAQEISEIVKNSISEASTITSGNRKRVEEGSTLVIKAAEAMIKIMSMAENVRTSSKHILEASKQQAIGMNQISIAMSQIDSQTQTNSATATETSATSENLTTEVHRLNALIDDLLEIVNGKNEQA